jgi:hypothetical protein
MRLAAARPAPEEATPATPLDVTRAASRQASLEAAAAGAADPAPPPDRLPCAPAPAGAGSVAERFLVLANMLRVLNRPDDVAGFLQRALAELPGVAAAEVALEPKAPCGAQWEWHRRVVGSGGDFGYIALQVADAEAFRPCLTALTNLIALVGQEMQSRQRLLRAERAEARLRRLLDTTQGRLAEQEGQARTLAQIARKTRNGVIVTDADGKVVWVNDSCQRITGYGLQDFVGRNPGKMLQGELTDPAASEEMGRARRNGEGCRVEIVNYAKDGRPIVLDIEIVPVRAADGTLEGFVAIETDVTETKRTLAALDEAKRQAEAANMAKSAFLAQMSHELRTPLNGILGFSELLAAPGLPLSEAKRAEYAGDIHGAATHLHRLLSDLLNVSALEAGRLHLASDPVPVAESLAEVLRGFGADLEGRGIAVLQEGLERGPDGPLRVRGDRRALVQILYNLISNALKHVPDGGQLAVTAQRSGRSLAIGIEDDGPGLPEEKHAELFQPFATIGDPLLTRQSGTGLGLSIVRGLVLAQGGSIRAGASRWGGACIAFALPLAEEA